MRKLSIAFCAALVAAGVLAAPVGGGSNTVKPVAAKAGKASSKHECLRFEFSY